MEWGRMRTEGASFTTDHAADGANSGINLDAAERFLQALDPDSDFFTFQTFDDEPDRHKKDPSLTLVLHGTLSKCGAELARLNERGAGAYVTINVTDGRGRTIENASACAMPSSSSTNPVRSRLRIFSRTSSSRVHRSSGISTGGPMNWRWTNFVTCKSD